MHLHEQRTTMATPVAGTPGDVTVTLTRSDLAAIDLALRVLLAASTPHHGTPTPVSTPGT